MRDGWPQVACNNEISHRFIDHLYIDFHFTLFLISVFEYTLCTPCVICPVFILLHHISLLAAFLCTYHSVRMGLAISLVSTVPEKVWYHSNCPNRGKGCYNTQLVEKGGCAIWYNEPQVRDTGVTGTHLLVMKECKESLQQIVRIHIICNFCLLYVCQLFALKFMPATL